MKQSKIWIVFIVAAMLMTACSNGPTKEQSENAKRVIEMAHKQRDYDKLLALADSLEKNGNLSHAEAYYWRGYASDRLKMYRMAEFYWKTALEACEESTTPEDLKIYAMTASRMANLLSVRGNYDGTLKMGVPAANRLEELKCDTTSDYVNLLIYIGCCQSATNGGSDAEDGFNRAYQKHKENIENNHTESAYKNAIAGLINIAYFCNYTKDYQKAMKWIGHFGEMINEYEQRPDADKKYIDKQIARFNIYKAIALEGQGKKEEAAAAFEDFKATEFSKTPEGKIQGNDYLAAAERWEEAVDNYHSLNELLDTQEKSMTLDDIHDLLLKKYEANLQAGRRDSAARVSMQVCDSLNNALALAKKLDAAEQATIVENVENVTEQHAMEARMKQMWLFGALILLFLGFVVYVYYQRHADRQLKKDHENLKKECARLEENVSSKEREQTELRLAHSLNSTAKAAEAHLPQNITAYAQLTPTNTFGTSICDYHTMGDKLFFCIGDVAGNSVESSMAAAIAKAQFRTASMLQTEPQQIVEAISESRNWNEPMTLFVGVMDMTSRMLKFYNAGHETPVIVGQEITRLDDVSGEIEMAKGTMIYLFNKGVLTAENKDHKQYGENKMLGAALQAMKTDARPEPFVVSIEENLNKFIGDTQQENDIMMLAIKC
jgi:serine phosphatase RsbU (regulator of sigma subunit)